MKKIKIDNDFGAIVAELGTIDERMQPEIYIYLEDKNGNIVQDIVLIRQAMDKHEKLIEAVECLVWSDKDTEDYTYEFIIEKYEEDE